MREEKRQGSMRIFQALSGVDSELLERSETEGKRHGNSLFAVRKGTGILAAAVCFAGAGVALWGMNEVNFFSSGNTRTMESAQEIRAEDSAAGAELPTEDGSGTGISNEDHIVPQQETAKTEGTEQDSASLSGEMPQQELTWQEALAVEILGDYLPADLPEGFEFETASSIFSETGQTLHVSWVNGRDEINLFISAAEADEIVFVDIQTPEAYDVRLYDVPYADSVPEEYRDSFEHPVFRSGDLSLEVIAARMDDYDDAGDTSTPRGIFAVYYEEDGVLVRFSGRAEAQSVWRMFTSIQQ